MIKRLEERLRRQLEIWRTEGFITMIKNVMRFARSRLFQWEKYYLYEHTISERNEADYIPRIDNITFKIIQSVREAKELEAANGLNILYSLVNARERLDRGGVAFCVFVEGELAHQGWVALCEESKNTFDTLPYKVDFTNNEACTGGTKTLPNFEGKGLMKYGYFKRFEFLKDQGVTVSRNAVAVNNLASQKVHAKFNPKIYATVCYLRLLGCRVYYKEKTFQLLSSITQSATRDNTLSG